MYNEGYSDDEIANLKRKKLQLKDEISSAKQKTGEQRWLKKSD